MVDQAISDAAFWAAGPTLMLIMMAAENNAAKAAVSWFWSLVLDIFHSFDLVTV